MGNANYNNIATRVKTASPNPTLVIIEENPAHNLRTHIVQGDVARVEWKHFSEATVTDGTPRDRSGIVSVGQWRKCWDEISNPKTLHSPMCTQ
jgi:hypothetical protein